MDGPVIGLDRVASRNLLDDVLTVKRIDSGLLDWGGAGPRDTVADEAGSAFVRRDRDDLGDGCSETIITSLAFAAADR